ncbi:MAG TPA: MarR family transcriptional regulator [Lachnospiraceae bacterium]|nr:MarR family transcriptional regulator [Lachnospiraceae bacterium]
MKADESCGMYIKQINSALEKDANNTLRKQDLTFAQVSALLAIRDFPEQKISLKELEKILHVAQSTTAGIINRLEQKGFVTAFGDSSDKRIKLVQMTSLGETYCQEAEQNMKRAEERLLSGLTETERSIFKTLLQKVRDTLQ